MEVLLMTVAENIKRIRKEKNITQKQLGLKCGIAESTIRRYELGLLNPKLETINKIADALEVDVYELDERIQRIQAGINVIDLLEQEKQSLRFLNPDDSFFQKHYDYMIEKQVKEIQDLSKEYSTEEVAEILHTYEERLLHLFNKLNIAGQKKAIEAVENITFNPNFLKKL